ELLPAEAGEHVLRTERAHRELCDLAQDQVPRGVAVGVVDALEMVDVEQHERRLRRVSRGEGDLGPQPLVEMEAVVGAGERVPRARLVKLAEEPLLPGVGQLESERSLRAEREGAPVLDAPSGDALPRDEGAVAGPEIF